MCLPSENVDEETVVDLTPQSDLLGCRSGDHLAHSAEYDKNRSKYSTIRKKRKSKRQGRCSGSHSPHRVENDKSKSKSEKKSTVRKEPDEKNKPFEKLQSKEDFPLYFYKDSPNPIKDVIINNVQKDLLTTLAYQPLLNENCEIIIGVDARPSILAGYCVNLKEKTFMYYVIKKKDFPWELHDTNDSSEFEMKNFMFALTLWKDEILKGNKRIRIYTDNSAITNAKFDGKKYGERAFKTLKHLTECMGVTVLNIDDMAVNRFEGFDKLQLFAQYIQPADDLSRWHIDKAIDFITKLYGIRQENVRGTHFKYLSSGPPATAKRGFNESRRYKETTEFVQRKIKCSDNCPNPECHASTVLQFDLRINNNKDIF